ncbi:MAG: hypothetical protein HC912_09620 [Saprospiraceae bacterium]|nr:hypothetical protein [Saprospiraceae bacterium]
MHFLKTTIALIWVVFGLGGSLLAQQTIQVATTEAFLKALGSNRTVVIAPGDYVLSNFEYLGLADYREAFDGYELLLSGFENLTIKSADTKNPAHTPSLSHSMDMCWYFKGAKIFALKAFVQAMGRKKEAVPEVFFLLKTAKM